MKIYYNAKTQSFAIYSNFDGVKPSKDYKLISEEEYQKIQDELNAEAETKEGE